MNSDDYIKFILDSDYMELWKDMKSLDPLNFKASKSYKDQIEESIDDLNASVDVSKKNDIMGIV